jgi:DNA-binding NarL/FixJ family response regulator
MAAGFARAVVVIMTFDDEEYLLGSIRAGASGFLFKDAGADLLAAAVRIALRGDTLIDPAMTRALLEERLSAETRAQSASSEPESAVLVRQRELLETLSERERQVLESLSRGLSNAAIAAEMFVSAATVKSHISSVLTKTATTSRVQAAVFAYEVGFVRPGWLAVMSRDIVDRCLGTSLIFMRSPAIGRALCFGRANSFCRARCCGC